MKCDNQPVELVRQLFNRLNWLDSYLTKLKTVLKPSNKLSDKQLIISWFQPVVFLFA